MKQEVALSVLGQIMRWDPQTATDEFKALSILSRFKYDGYADYVAGARFLERLAQWLQQFDLPDRQVMYQFVRKRLLFVTAAELDRLIEAFFPRFVFYDVLGDVARTLRCHDYQVLFTKQGTEMFSRELRSTLFIGMSDGARLDVLRRYNVQSIKNDQFLLSVDADDLRWEGIYRDLCEALEVGTTFKRLYLIDDFVASGATFLKEVATRKGKVFRFQKRFEEARQKGYVDDKTLVLVHHFLSTHEASSRLNARLEEANSTLPKEQWFPRAVTARASYIMPDSVKLRSPDDDAVMAVCTRHYDPTIEKPRHGQTEMQLGYLGCALPLVLEHNTPNNSVTVLWKEHAPGDPTMRALFRRRERY
jgi:hypothetical protein